MALAGTYFSMFRAADATAAPRELAALDHATAWLNSPALTAESLAGKVVIVDFWAYTCINWLRTLPYIRAWSQKYRQGLVVIGVHTPEFPIERNIDNVRRAVQQMGVQYPIAIDNDYAIWRAFDNEYWPALYLIDARGRVRQHHFGEGEYEASETGIQRLLDEAKIASGGHAGVSVDARGVEAPADWENLGSGENYVGYGRTERFASRGGIDADRRHSYVVPGRLALNEWALGGDWTIGKEATVLNGSGGRMAYRFHARDLHLVMGPGHEGKPVRFRVLLDGRPPREAHGLDIDGDGNGVVMEPRLYQLIRQPRPIVDRVFEIEFLGSNVETFSYTFG